MTEPDEGQQASQPAAPAPWAPSHPWPGQPAAGPPASGAWPPGVQPGMAGVPAAVPAPPYGAPTGAAFQPPIPAPPPGWGVPVPPPPPGHAPRAVRVDPLPGTPFGVAYLGVSPTVSGLAVGSMVGGIGSILVAMVVICFGVAGAQPGWGPLVSGAFAILAGLAGGAALAIGLVAMGQIRRSPAETSGRGMAVTGVACGGSGLALTLLGFILAVAMSQAG